MLRNLMPKGLFGRALILIVAPMIILQAIITFIFIERHLDTVTRRLARGLTGSIAYFVEMEPRLRDQNLQDETVDALARHEGLLIRFDPGANLPPPVRPGLFNLKDGPLSIEIQNRVGKPFWIDTESRRPYIDIRIKLDDGVLQVLAPANRLEAGFTDMLLYWMAGLTLVLGGVAVAFLRNQVRPIGRLADAAESFGMGRDVPDFKPSGAAEVRRAAAEFIAMRERINRFIEQRTAMLAAVSHDLRTPLTRLKLELELMGDHAEIRDMRADVDEMAGIIDEYLAFARGQAGEEAEVMDLAALAAEVAADARRQGAEVTLQTPDLVEGAWRRQALKRLLTNLVDNARTYGGRVWIELRAAGNGIELTVEDDGPGIPPQHYDDAFRPFQRLDPARTPGAGGVGLGLAIARDVARGHGGEIMLGKSAHGGLAATLQLPR